MNPFVLNKYNGPEYFCDRKQETKSIIQALQSGRSITLYADRRLGKTALIHHILYNLNKKRPKVITAYVDVFDTLDERMFTKKMVSSIITAIENSERSVFNTAKKYFSHIKPKMGFDPITNLPEFSFDIETEQEVNLTLSTLFSYLKEKKKPIVIAIDEFQQILEYKASRLAATLRGHIQNIPNVTFIFSGSKKHTLLHMFSSPNQPFFSSTQLFPLLKIDNEEYKTFIQRHFKRGGKSIDDDHVSEILRWTNTHTYNVQVFCSRLYELDGKSISIADIKTIKEQIFYSYEQVYYNYRELLTFMQWQLLKAIGIENELIKPTGKDFIKKHELGSHSSIKRALTTLVDKDMVSVTVNEMDEKVYYIQDVFLRRWIQYKYAQR